LIFMRGRVFPSVVAVMALSLAPFPGLRAQTEATGAVAGKVSQAQGASLSGVTVIAVNAATSRTFSTRTGKSGAYEFKQLAPGTYALKFSASGYKLTDVRNISLNGGDALTINEALIPGSQKDEIDLEWTAARAGESADGSEANVTGSKSIPLASRNYTQAASLEAGVSSQMNNATNIGINTQDVQVGSGSTNNYMVDGASVAISAMGADAPGIPNPDAIRENKVQSWSYDAGPERNSGANISVVTKSGSNSFHGTAFEFVRNDIFNSNEYFRKSKNLPKPVLKQNQFGFSIGGPIKKDKAYLFGSYQGTRQRNGFASAGFSSDVTLPVVPNTRDAAALGEFYCGSTGYKGGVSVACDGSNVNPVAVKILNLKMADGSYYIPGSGTSVPETIPFSLPAKFEENQFLVNADYVVSSKHTIAERFFYARDPQTSNFTAGSSSLPGTPTAIVAGNIYAVIKLTSALTPKFQNEIRIAGQHNTLTDTPKNTFTNSEVGITSLVPQFDMLDIIAIQGLFTAGGRGNWDRNSVNQYQIADDISWLHGRHTIRAGAEIGRRQWNVYVFGDAQGWLGFMSFPDFLLGLPGCPPSAGNCSATNSVVDGVQTSGSSYSNVYLSSGPSGTTGNVTSPDGIHHEYRFSDYSAYAQDEVKLTPRLAVTLGLRWEFYTLPIDLTGNMTNFFPSLGDAWVVPPWEGSFLGFVVPANYKGDLATGVYKNKTNLITPSDMSVWNFAPRVGFSWQPLGNSKTVVRGGYGHFYDRLSAEMLQGQSIASVPYATPVGGSGVANYRASFAEPYTATVLGWGPARTANLTTGESSNLVVRARDTYMPTPMTQKWNLEIQQQLFSNWTIVIGYAGAHSIHLQNTSREINQSVLASPSNPIYGITTNTEQNALLRVPFLGIAPNGMDLQQTAGTAKYNSLQATLATQMSHGVQVQAAYTFSKNLSNLAQGAMLNSNDPLDARQQYGPSNNTAPQQLAVNYSWALPWKGSGMKGRLIGDWSLSGVTITQSGTPMTLQDAQGGTIYGGAGNSRAQYCDGMSARNAGTSGSVGKRINAFFNQAAFADTTYSLQNTPGCSLPILGDDGKATGYGNTSVGFIRGPGHTNTDLSASKSIAIKDTKIELRMEMFNVFNHPQFSNPDTNVTDATFGQITSTAVNPRLIQFALKYSF
jgi:hypothetical protein